MIYTVVANTGIHITSFPFEINTKEKFQLWFHEWYNTENGEWTLGLVQEINDETNQYFYNKKTLFENGYLQILKSEEGVNVQDLYDEGIKPIMIDDEMQVTGNIFKLSFVDKSNVLSKFENKWLPIPYFYHRSETKFKFGSLNWSRFKLLPISESEGIKKYKVLLALDTRTKEKTDKYEECPVFPDQFATELRFDVCPQEFQLMDFCSPNPEWEYINDYLFKLVHPELSSVGKIKQGHKLTYIATYFLLIDYIAQKKLFPQIILYRDKGTVVKDVDMVVDIGNSRTAALLVEDNSNFNQVCQLQLIDFTQLNDSNKGEIVTYQEPFDMRLAMRKVEFGEFGIQGSRQFVYPSFVRLGKEAISLIHKASETEVNQEKYSTMSSPKRYLWDGKRSKEEWQFITLEGEKDKHILNIPGISEQLQSNGSLATMGTGGQSYHYSRRSMMTFAFLEMLSQAEMQINSDKYRTDRGDKNMPRRIRRIIITCPTAMSKLEREALVKCASDAVKLLNNFNGSIENRVDIIPSVPSIKDKENKWYYDEATCSQLVYIYGEVGYKYKGNCQEFFNLYGEKDGNEKQPHLTIGSLDIGAGTSDLMISRYTYTSGDVTTIQPDPLFYDSYYYAGDDMLNELIKHVMFFSQSSALREHLQGKKEQEYRQILRNFFGPDHTGQTIADRRLRRDFNMQYSIPLMYKFLDLLSKQAQNCIIRYKDIFEDNEPNWRIRKGFEDFFGFPLEDLEWRYDNECVSEVVRKAFEPLLKKIATIMFSYNCNIVLLSGRPSSLAPIRNIFLKYYPVSPNRLILLNNYFVGYWYPFSENTGHITNPKTIVAMGALIGYYATSLGNLDRFVLDKSKLDEKLKPVINYIEASREGLPIEYFITPQKPIGELMVSSLPLRLNIRQLGIDSYPSRELYVIDFNENKIGERLRAKASKEGISMTDLQVQAKVKDVIDDMRLRMPYYVTIEQDPDNKEQLSVTGITDRNGTDIGDGYIEINIQSLGVNNQYWLDTGAFEIQ